ncbi:S8 family serine peptidase [Halorubrum sp. N11]|uniref:S8 family serine peptidase n=1 Tax=Halorubrum sp. N11 TaxID=3402276 RepID=UPI003EBFB5D9
MAVLLVALLVSVSAVSLAGASATTAPSIDAASTAPIESTNIGGPDSAVSADREIASDAGTNPPTTDTANTSAAGDETETYLLVLDDDLTIGPTRTAADVERAKRNAERAQAPVVDRLEAQGIPVTAQFWITNTIMTTVDPDAVTPADLKTIDGVTRVEPNIEFQRPKPQPGGDTGLTAETTATTDGIGATTYGLEQINVDGFVDSYHTNGSGTRVAILDDGLNGSHPDLNVTLGVNVSDGTVSDPATTTLQPDSGHGDHVAGTAVGTTTPAGDVARYSVAPDAALLKADVFVGGATLTDVLAAIQWAVEEDADVVSMSLGLSASDTDSTIILSMDDAIQNANNAGTVVIGSAGNDGSGSTGGRVSSPGAEFPTVSIGATDATGDVASFSSGARIAPETTVVLADGSGTAAPYPDHYPHTYVKPDVTAPGVDVVSAGSLNPIQENPTYSTASGTSMAAPHVAGAVALLQSATPAHREPHVLINALAETARKPDGTDATSRDIRYGMGVIDVLAARNALNSTTTINGTVTNSTSTLTGAAITTDSGVIAATDAGTYAIEPTTDATTVSVTANEYGYAPETTSVTTGGSETLEFELNQIESIRVELNATQIETTEKTDLTVIADHPDGTESDITEEATVTSSNTSVARINTATISGDSAGTTTITAHYDGLTAKSAFEVIALETITLELSDTTVTTGQSVTATVTGTYTDGTSRTFTDNATITAGDTTIAAIDNATITGLSSGTTTITATVDNETATADLTVLDPAFFDVNVTQSPSSVVEGEPLTLEYTVTNTGDRTSTQDITVSINGAEHTNEPLQLEPNTTINDTVTYQTQSGDAPSLDVEIASTNVTVTETVAVQTPPHFLVTIDAINDTVLEGDTITVAYTVTNTGDAAGTQSVALRTNGTTQNTTTTTLAGGATTNSTFHYQTQSGDVPALTISVASADTTATESVTVDAPAGFTVTIDENVSTGTLTKPDPIVVAAEIKNGGTFNGTEPITYTLTRDENRTTRNVTNVTVPGRTTTTVTFTTPTSDLEVGEYVATVDGETDTDTQPITLEPEQPVEEGTGGGGGGGGGGQASLTGGEREEFMIRSSTQSATAIRQGESFSVAADIENTGVQGAQQIQLLLDGTQTATKSVLLRPREITTVTFENLRVDADPGEYPYQVVTEDDTAQGTITVRGDAESVTATPDTETAENDTATVETNTTEDADTTADAEPDGEPTETADENPGFGLGVAVVSLLLVSSLLWRRSQR